MDLLGSLSPGPPGISEPSTYTREKDALHSCRAAGVPGPSNLPSNRGDGFLSFSQEVSLPLYDNFIDLFFVGDFWLLWIFVALSGLPLVEVRGAPLHCGVRASHCSGFSCCRARAVGCEGFSSCSTWVW